MSGDTVAGQALFKKAHQLSYPLLSDAKGAIAKTFGVKVGKGGTLKLNVLGKQETLTRTVTTGRSSFLIGEDGTLLYKNLKARPVQDCKEILDVVAKIEKKKAKKTKGGKK